MSTLALLGDEDVAASGWDDDNSTFVFEFPPASFMLIESVIDNTPAIMGADASAAAAAGVSAAEIEIAAALFLAGSSSVMTTSASSPLVVGGGGINGSATPPRAAVPSGG